MHPGWQGGFPKRVLWKQFRASTSGSCSEPPSGETSPCSWTRKEKLAGEAGSLRLHGMGYDYPHLRLQNRRKWEKHIQNKNSCCLHLADFPKRNSNGF